MTVSNLGGVGVQIVRIYINSTGSGCTSLCVLNPTLHPHQVHTRSTKQTSSSTQVKQITRCSYICHHCQLCQAHISTLPEHDPYRYESWKRVLFQVAISNSNGRSESISIFRWNNEGRISVYHREFRIQLVRTNPGLCYDSKNEAGPVAAGSGGTVTSSYCHQEPVQAYQAGSTYAEKLTVRSDVTGGELWFVSPWVTQPIFISAQTNGPASFWPFNLAIQLNNALYLREYYKRREHTLCHQRGFDRSDSGTVSIGSLQILLAITRVRLRERSTRQVQRTPLQRVRVSTQYSKSLPYV